MNKYRFRDNVFRADVLLEIVDTESYLDMDVSDLDGAHFKLVNGDHVIWLRRFDWGIRRWSSLVHEIVHLADGIMRSRGIGNDTEVRAYYVEYWTERMFKRLQKDYG